MDGAATFHTHHHHKHISYIYYILCNSADLTLTFKWVLAKSVYRAYLIGMQESHKRWTSSMKLFDSNLFSAKWLAASHSNSMSNMSLTNMLFIPIPCHFHYGDPCSSRSTYWLFCLPQGISKCEYYCLLKFVFLAALPVFALKSPAIIKMCLLLMFLRMLSSLV